MKFITKELTSLSCDSKGTTKSTYCSFQGPYKETKESAILAAEMDDWENIDGKWLCSFCRALKINKESEKEENF